MNIKIDYKNKLHSIGKDNSSLAQIADAIKVRYPGQFQHGVIIAVIDNGNVHEVKTFEEIVNFWKTNGNSASVKIKVFEAPENSEKKEEEKQIILQNADPIYTASVYEGSVDGLSRGCENSDVFEIQDESRISEQKMANPFLKNKELDQSMEVKSLKMEKKEESIQGITLQKIDQIIQQRVRAIIQELDLVTRKQFNALKQKQAEIKKEEEKEKSVLSQIEDDLKKAEEPVVKPRGQSFDGPLDHKVKFANPPLNVVKAEASTKYVWKVNFTNYGAYAWPSHVSVYKTSNKMVQIMEVKSLQPGESTEIVLDMIAPSSKGSESKQFRLGYIDEKTDSLTFFGPKFGFLLQTSKSQQSLVYEKKPPVSQEDDKELARNVLEACKHVRNQRHDPKLLTKSIKDLGLDYKSSKDILIDIIVQLQGQRLS